jgi:type IV pilus assembly protein PilF
MSMAFSMATASARRLLAASFTGVAVASLAVLLAGCVNTRTTTTSLADTSSGKGAEIVTESDETSRQRRARLRMELASGYFEHGQTTVALDEIKQALVADPNYADAYSLRGLIYMRLEDAGMAEDSFRRAVAINPRDPNVRHKLRLACCASRTALAMRPSSSPKRSRCRATPTVPRRS